MVPLHHQKKLKNREKILPPFLPPQHKGGGGEDAPFENCAKKQRVGTKPAHLSTPYCTEVTSLCAPLAIEGHTDGDGEEIPAPVVVKLEGAERGKKGGTVPAVTTTAPDKPTGLAGDACCECGQQSSCNTARCGCWVVGRNCVSCRCLVRCANVTPQTWQDKQRTTQRKTGDGARRQRGKRRRGRGRGEDATANAGATRDEENTTHATRTADETKDAVTTATSPQTTKRKGTEAPAKRTGAAEEME